MNKNKIDNFFKNLKIQEYNTVIIGSGAAGLNAAIHLSEEGISTSDIAIITERLGGGTSFNAGSDKQTYYKLSIIGDERDSPYEMAVDLFKGGAMHGDIALVEATNSIREFFHLVNLGVKFPHDRYGGFVGYKTDNDPRQRATSIGPFTSREMGKCLLAEVRRREIKIFDKLYGIKILVNHYELIPYVLGVLCINVDSLTNAKDIETILGSFTLFKSNNVILATGGPAMIYKNTVYPESQFGSTSLAIEAGCVLQNLTESQFGIASIKFRWNVSGSYQQVIPRYYSIDSEGNEYEFLNQYFPDFNALSKAIFLKGYEWPFSSERIVDNGSSLIDLAVYYETEQLNRKVLLDYTKNPEGYQEANLHPLVNEYLEKSEAKGAIPIIRLRKMNEKAYALYRENGIDIAKEPLEIALCNQHLNGGVSGDIWWESSVKRLFAIGEVNGSHGIHRPGGSALNSGQVGGLRAAQKIANRYSQKLGMTHEAFLKLIRNDLINYIEIFEKLIGNVNKSAINLKSFDTILNTIKYRTSNYGTIIRKMEGLENEIQNIQQELINLSDILLIEKNIDIINFFRLKDALITQWCIFRAIFNYHELSGGSRGSYLILRDFVNDVFNEVYNDLPYNLNHFNYITNDLDFSDEIQTIKYEKNMIKVEWVKRRKIPRNFGWFETTWKKYDNREIYS